LKIIYKLSIVVSLVFIINEGNAQWSAGFVAADTTSCLLDSIKFTNTSTGDYDYIEWDFNNDGIPDLFGDPTVDTSLVNPTYLYEEAGLFSVKLTIDSGGLGADSFTRTDYIIVFENPTPAFILNYTDSCAPILVEGINQSTQGEIGIDSLNWFLRGPDSAEFFGDMVTIPITKPLDYFVYLTVVDSLGCSSTTDSVLVALNKIDLNFTYEPNACNETQYPIEFFTDGSFPPYSYQWIFGTGDTVNFVDITDTTVFTIDISGLENDTTFLDSVTVTDNTGCSFTWEFEISVTIPQLTVLEDIAGLLICDSLFSIDWEFPLLSESTNVDTFFVDFGDGNSDGTNDPLVAAQGILHTYNSVGVFNVEYSVSDTNGCTTSEKIDSLVWVQGPKVDPVWEVEDPCLLIFNFDTVNVSEVDSVLWFFSDLDSTNLWSPTHTFSELPAPTPKLWAYGEVDINEGEQTNAVCPIEYFAPSLYVEEPFLFFTFENGTDSICEGEEVEIKNQSINNSEFVIEKWIWNFGDDSDEVTQTGPDPDPIPLIHEYPVGKTEKYVVTLLVITEGACEFEYEDSLFVMPPLDLQPALSDFQGCVPLTIIFNPDTSGLIDQISNPLWHFGDGSTSGLLISEHTYEINGKEYTVTFDYTSDGCLFENVDMAVITTFATPIAELSYTPVTSNNSIVSFDIINQSTGAERVEWWLDGVLFSTDNQINIQVTEKYQLLLLKAFSSEECEDTMELDLKGILVNPVNIITPNGDTFNDVLKFDILEKQACLKLLVYDRWGRTVYEDNSYADDWGGINKNGQELSEGTYFYSLDVCGDFVVTGYLTIVR